LTAPAESPRECRIVSLGIVEVTHRAGHTDADEADE
jgi:hypothetical protein